MNDKKILLILDNYYKPIKYILEKLFLCKIYLISDISKLNNYDISYFYKKKISAYKQGLDNGCNIVLNNNDNDILDVLKNEGYKFEQYNITNNIFKNYKIIKKINNKINIFNYLKYYLLINLSILLINNFQKYIRTNIGFEINKGNFERIEKSINNNLLSRLNIFTILKKYFYYKNRLNSIYLDKPKKCLNICIISNDYILDKLYYDYTLELLLASKNMICHRDIGKKYINKYKIKYYLYIIKKYCKYNIGSNVIRNIFLAIKSIDLGMDGIIFIKQEGNKQDISTSIILDNACNKNNIPIINLNYNESISELKIENNINVLYDLIKINNKLI